MRWKWEAKLRLHVNGKILTLGLRDHLLRVVVEACSLGLEQPDREGAQGTTLQGTILPFALGFPHKAPLPALLLEDLKECLSRRLSQTAALGILIYPRSLIFYFSCLDLLTSCLQCLSKFIVQFYYSLLNNCSFTLDGASWVISLFIFTTLFRCWK